MKNVAELQLYTPLKKQTELLDVLKKVVGWRSVDTKLIAQERIKSKVYRFRFEQQGQSRSLIAKQLDPVIARRTELTANRWLPSANLGHIGPPLLAVAAQRNGQHVWHVYEDFGQCTLNSTSPDPIAVNLVIDCVAKLHGSFAEHPLLAECRLRGTILCINRYTTNILDAIRSLERCRTMNACRSSDRRILRCELLERLHSLLRDAPRRERLLTEFGGPQTLLHGDLWPTNVLLYDSKNGLKARLIDWDRAGVGIASYDLSTFLSRLPAAWRTKILDQYKRSIEPFGVQVPDVEVLNLLFDTAERARIVYCIIWSALAVWENESEWAFENLSEHLTWFRMLKPLLPVNGETSETICSTVLEN